MNKRWRNGFCCPRCDHTEFFRIRTRNLLECKECRTQISLTAGTVMHKSKLPLLTWFKAIYLLIRTEQIYTASALAQQIDVNYRTARLMLNKIQCALHKRYDRIDSPKANESAASKRQMTAATSHTQAELIQKLAARQLAAKLPLKGAVNLTSFIFKNSGLIPHNTDVLLSKWVDACISVFQYPRFLRYHQVH